MKETETKSPHHIQLMMGIRVLCAVPHAYPFRRTTVTHTHTVGGGGLVCNRHGFLEESCQSWFPGCGLFIFGLDYGLERKKVGHFLTTPCLFSFSTINPPSCFNSQNSNWVFLWFLLLLVKEKKSSLSWTSIGLCFKARGFVNQHLWVKVN